ncbi:LysR family transcriptional regulator [Cohaesibacter gelatinilyticus]|uniref:Transcriptional regulator n=1 Tax=Cohaesibacter gelatinilyticus TaxID=372072 RepID=A0A285PIF7_9HYPH|nr:LysR family transcriptional regulator [Cohaesibacter gelatinilyticus]SNZ21063.1 transcriptional regulator [Cohaesibacter gelatinilyticus]
MELIGLRTFKAIVDEDGIKGASKALHTVPSNVSARIQKLEEELGVPLFTLRGRKLHLTPQGQLLYPYAAQMIELENNARTELRRSGDIFELRIGTTETFAATFLPDTLKKLKQHNAKIIPKIITHTSAELISCVLKNSLDCAFIGTEPIHVDLCCYPLIEESLLVVLPKDQEHDSVLFVRDEGCAYRQAAVSWQQKTGRSDEQIMSMSSVEGVLGCIAAGLGYTVIGESMVKGSRYENSLSTRLVDGPATTFRLSLICRKNSPFQHDIEAIAKLFKQEDQG